MARPGAGDHQRRAHGPATALTGVGGPCRLRDAGTHVVTALSGSETVEQGYALAKLMRAGLGAHTAVMPEVDNARLLDGFRLPLSSIRDAEVVVVLGDEPVPERAPVGGDAREPPSPIERSRWRC